MQTKFIFITGGVVSGLGKGIAASSIGALLESRGLKVSLAKLDPYINVDAGTMNPYQHGEVFVTEDGAETDLDLGHYERYTNRALSRKNNFTTGQVYDSVIRKERAGDYLGGTIQVVPHIIDEIKHKIMEASEGADVAIIEIGGTAGDIESLPFLEAIRQVRHDQGRENTLFIHLTLIIYLESDEMKTKPTQHSVGKLREIGIQPDILICRTKKALPQSAKQKIALFTNVAEDAVINGLDVETVYEVPLVFHDQSLDKKILSYLQMWTREPQLEAWQSIVSRFKNPKDEVQIAFVGKYVEHKDSYESLNEALRHGGIGNEVRVSLKYINSEELEGVDAKTLLEGMHGILVAPGFGGRGIEGKINAAQYAREQKIPFFGICLGMQAAVIEYARNKAGIAEANSEEFTPEGKQNVIGLMPEQAGQVETGGTMRLGGYPALLNEDSRIAKIYSSTKISERHRHRYEVINDYVPQLEKAGLIISGRYEKRNLVETVEIQDHPWFLACQFHPELKSRPSAPHPLFVAFIEASLHYKQKQGA